MATAEQLITDNLDTWITAIQTRSAAGRGKANKLELYGIKKLRELILELAVRGLLVPQDPNDEPASELLKKIADEKARLVKDGKIKKPKALPAIEDDEKPYELPDGWMWARLGDATNYGTCDKAESKDVGPDTWVLELEDVEKVSSRLLVKVRFSDRQFRSTKNVFSDGDVIYGKLRPYLDKVLVADEPGVCTTEMIPVRGYACLIPSYLRLAMKSPSFVAYANESTHGMNLPRMGTVKARLALIPLLSEAEQNRIVAKVDELMALCDHLEQQQEASITAHQTLVQTLLDVLTTASERDGFSAAWARIADHFDTLFTTEWSIEQLKQTILQLAIMGNLVTQEPNDEPASELLKKIAAQKAQLAKDGKIKKQTTLPDIEKDELPFDLPQNWEWVRLGALSPSFQNGASSRGDKEGKDVVVIRLADIEHYRVTLTDPRVLTISTESIEKYGLLKDDILIIRVNGSADIVGRFVLCHQDFEAIYCDHFIRMRFPVKALISGYLGLLGSSKLIRERIEDLFVSTAGQKTVNQKHISSLLVSMPPIEEQKRIVAKVDELMALCNALKTRIHETETTQAYLADAVTEQSFANT